MWYSILIKKLKLQHCSSLSHCKYTLFTTCNLNAFSRSSNKYKTNFTVKAFGQHFQKWPKTQSPNVAIGELLIMFITDAYYILVTWQNVSNPFTQVDHGSPVFNLAKADSDIFTVQSCLSRPDKRSFSERNFVPELIQKNICSMCCLCSNLTCAK